MCGTDKEQRCIYMPLQSVGNLYSIVNSFLLENIFCLLCATALAGWDDNLTILGRDGMKHQVCSSQKQRIFDKPKRVAAHIIHLFKYQFLGMNAESRLFRWKKSSYDLPHGPPLDKLFWRQFTQKKGAYNVTNAIHFDMKIEPLQCRPCISDCFLPLVWDEVFVTLINY